MVGVSSQNGIDDITYGLDGGSRQLLIVDTEEE